MSEDFIVKFVGLEVIGLHEIHRNYIQFDVMPLDAGNHPFKINNVEFCLASPIGKQKYSLIILLSPTMVNQSVYSVVDSSKNIPTWLLIVQNYLTQLIYFSNKIQIRLTNWF